mgnify:CR=1 FL=1
MDWFSLKSKIAAEAVHWAIAFLIASVILISIVDAFQVYFIAKNSIAIQRIEADCEAKHGR